MMSLKVDKTIAPFSGESSACCDVELLTPTPALITRHLNGQKTDLAIVHNDDNKNMQ